MYICTFRRLPVRIPPGRRRSLSSYPLRRLHSGTPGRQILPPEVSLCRSRRSGTIPLTTRCCCHLETALRRNSSQLEFSSLKNILPASAIATCVTISSVSKSPVSRTLLQHRKQHQRRALEVISSRRGDRFPTRLTERRRPMATRRPT